MKYLVTLCLLSCYVWQAEAQIGVTVCACQPSIYTFQINFTSLCKNTNIIGKPGIKGVDCFQRGIGSNPVNITDTVPVQISSINVLELNTELAVLAQTPIPGSYQDGDTFEYTSPITGTPEGIASLTPETIPAGLQIDLVGINKIEQPITNVWIILFTNDCGFYPVLDIGDNIGWTTLIDFEQPFETVCPIAAPSVEPSDSASIPTLSPSPTFSRKTEIPTNEPSDILTHFASTMKPSIECIPKPSMKKIRSSRSYMNSKRIKSGSKSFRDTYSNPTSSNESPHDELAPMSRGVGHDRNPLPYCESVKMKKSSKQDSKSSKKLWESSKKWSISVPRSKGKKGVNGSKHSKTVSNSKGGGNGSKHSDRSSQLPRKKEEIAERRSKIQKLSSEKEYNPSIMASKVRSMRLKKSKSNDSYGGKLRSTRGEKKQSSGSKDKQNSYESDKKSIIPNFTVAPSLSTTTTNITLSPSDMNLYSSSISPSPDVSRQGIKSEQNKIADLASRVRAGYKRKYLTFG